MDVGSRHINEKGTIGVRTIRVCSSSLDSLKLLVMSFVLSGVAEIKAHHRLSRHCIFPNLTGLNFHKENLPPVEFNAHAKISETNF